MLFVVIILPHGNRVVMTTINHHLIPFYQGGQLGKWPPHPHPPYTKVQTAKKIDLYIFEKNEVSENPSYWGGYLFLAHGLIVSR